MITLDFPYNLRSLECGVVPQPCINNRAQLWRYAEEFEFVKACESTFTFTNRTSRSLIAVPCFLSLLGYRPQYRARDSIATIMLSLALFLLEGDKISSRLKSGSRVESESEQRAGRRGGDRGGGGHFSGSGVHVARPPARLSTHHSLPPGRRRDETGVPNLTPRQRFHLFC